jgi:hypothetical protein
MEASAVTEPVNIFLIGLGEGLARPLARYFGWVQVGLAIHVHRAPSDDPTS